MTSPDVGRAFDDGNNRLVVAGTDYDTAGNLTQDTTGGLV
jgi:hypothetical protein